ncbi:MAG: DUF697 domain-containing protein [Lacipirellulaceae bacterium]
MTSSAANSPANGAEGDLRDALAAVERAIAQLEQGDSGERHALAAELRELQDLAEKLRHGRVEVAVFGEVSTGKSALVNALAGSNVAGVNARAGWTRDVIRTAWGGTELHLGGLGDSELVLVDTPGLNEVQGEARADLARYAAERADVVVFVTDSDLNETEHTALAEAAALHKPLLLVLNKADLYLPADRDKLAAALRAPRVTRLVGGPENVVFASADPREVEHLIEGPDGRTRSEWRKPRPDVDAVKGRILELLADEGKALVALSASMYAADRTDRVAALRVRMRAGRAERVVWTYAVAKALAVAWNPAPVFDVAGGLAFDATMVVTLAGVYGIPITTAGARELVLSILKAAGWMIATELAVSVGASLAKALTLGGSTWLTAIPQGAAAGYGSYLVGQAARCYFEQGASWGPHGPKSVVARILKNTDKGQVVGRLKDEIRAKLGKNRHGAGQ